MATSRTASTDRRPRWLANGSRDCRACEGQGEVESSDSNDPQDSDPVCCPVCLGSCTMPANWGGDPLLALRTARRTMRGWASYRNIRARAMRPVRLPGVAA